MTVTRIIAGRELTLTRGRRYEASRPMVSNWRTLTHFDVKITDVTDGYSIDAPPATVVPALSYEQANELLRQFNAGRPWQGREWK